MRHFPSASRISELRDLIDRARPTKALANYYAAVTTIDEGVGRLLDTLDAERLEEETLVVYTSDHGLNCGHHGIWGKGNGTLPLNMVDETIRVPLVIAGPDIVAQRRAEFVDHLDLFQTLVSYCEVTSPADRNFAGRSYAPILTGAEIRSWRDTQFCEYGDVQMIRTERYKLVRYCADKTVRLFDLDADAREERDVADQPHLRAIRDALEQRLRAHYLTYSAAAKSGTRPGGPQPTNMTSPWVLRK
ncbi:MAG: sulfatase-like hydrolase/transferase [Mesorhizobium sp.]